MAKASEYVHIRLTPEQKEGLAKLAADYGKTMSELVLLMAEYTEEKRPVFQLKSATPTAVTGKRKGKVATNE